MKTTLFLEVSTLRMPHLTAHAIKAQFVGPLSGFYSAAAKSCYLQPCVPWTANFTWINSTPATNEPLIAEVDAFDDATSYRWFVDGNLIETTSGPYLHTYNGPCTYGRLTVMAINPCGKSEIIDGDYYFPNCTMYYSNVQVYPNPAGSEVTYALLRVQRFTTIAKRLKQTATLPMQRTIKCDDKDVS